MSQLKDYLLSLKKRKGLLIIVTAAILIELVSAAQYYYTYKMMERHLEKRAENELTFKAILIKNSLNATEDVLKYHLWDIRSNLYHPDSVYKSVERLVTVSRYVHGGFMTFVPNYYPQKGRLFEPYALLTSEGITMSQIAGDKHDYTTRPFFQKALDADDGVWVDPYEDVEGARTSVTSYVIGVRNKSGEKVGVAGIDMALDWLADTINSRHILPSSFNLLLTEAGIPIALPAESNVKRQTTDYIVKLINDSTFKRSLSSSRRSKLVRFKYEGKKGTVFYANMRGKPHWQIAVVCYDDEVYEELTSLRLRILLLLLLAFGFLLFMIRRFVRNEDMLKKKSLEQERMAGELHIASEIQKTLLPSPEEMFANSKDISIKGLQIPAKSVGGDLYNAFVRDDKLFFCIGDVSGKGVPSALVMAIVQALFRNIASRENNPAHIMTQLNEMACRNNKENFFVTLFVGVLDLPSGHLRFCNAGHEVPFIIKKQAGSSSDSHTECRLMDVKANLPIGLFSDFSYEMQGYAMEKGSALFLYTDGLTEARNAQKEQFKVERISQVLAECNTIVPEQLVEKIIDALNSFTRDTEQTDDMTILTLMYEPVEETLLLDEEITVQNDVKQVEQLGIFVKDVMNRLNIGKSLASQLRLAVEEAVVNVMEYAYPAGSTGEINIKVTSDGHRLRFVITDTGIPFNPTEAASADTTLSAEERPVGGLGIFLVRQMMDSINYERIGGKNVLKLRKDY